MVSRPRINMMPRADLFVVCKNPECGQEVSPYVTECPYCGTRLRKRAPKLDRGRPRQGRRMPLPRLSRLRAGEIPGVRAERAPYATIALIVATCGVWIALRGGYVAPGRLVVYGGLRGEWWRALTTQFAYFNGIYQFLTLFAVALFGWLLERRHGPVAVIALFLLGGAGGALVAGVLDTQSLVSGANGGALALLCAWAVPDLLARRRGAYYDGDLLGVGVFALVLLALPLARPEASAIAGGIGVVVGYAAGLALAAVPQR
jgi:membrane associated rhomboid family serine protease